MKKIIALLCVLSIIAAAYLYLNNYIEENLEAVDLGDDSPIVVEIPAGSTTNDIAEILFEFFSSRACSSSWASATFSPSPGLREEDSNRSDKISASLAWRKSWFFISTISLSVRLESGFKA